MNQQKAILPTELKVCGKCHKQKAKTEFYPRTPSPDGLRQECKECTKKKSLATHRRIKSTTKNTPQRAICRKCHKEKPRSDFHKNSGSLSGISGQCKECINAYHKILRSKHSSYPISVKSSRCSRCKQVKGISEFSRNQYNTTGLSCVCKPCASRARFQKYKLSSPDFDEMVKRQKGKCALCGDLETTTHYGKVIQLSIDHDHRPGGKARALLCHRCNFVLGRVRDNTILLQKMIDYLNRFA